MTNALSRLRNALSDLIPPPKITKGHAAGLRCDPGASNPQYRTGENEPFVQQAFADHLDSGGILFDIGANVGFFSVLGARLVGERGKVFSFEPLHANARVIARNARLNRLKNITIVEKAVAESSGRQPLLVTEYAGGAVLASGDHRSPDVIRTEWVETVSVDDLIFSAGFPAPSFVKIDVEGAEAKVLEGMRRTLRELRPTVLFEIDDIDSDAFWRKQKACEALLAEFRYGVESLEDSYPSSKWIVRHTLATPPRVP